MHELLRPFDFEFFRNGLIVATMAGGLCGAIGAVVRIDERTPHHDAVVRRQWRRHPVAALGLGPAVIGLPGPPPGVGFAQAPAASRDLRIQGGA